MKHSFTALLHCHDGEKRTTTVPAELKRLIRDIVLLATVIILAFCFFLSRLSGETMRAFGWGLIILASGLSIFFIQHWRAFRDRMEDALRRDYGNEIRIPYEEREDENPEGISAFTLLANLHQNENSPSSGPETAPPTDRTEHS